MDDFPDTVPDTVIVRSVKENPKKCSVIPLKGKPGIVLLNYPFKKTLSLPNYIRLSAEGPPLSSADYDKGILLLDGSWRTAGNMERDFASIPPRSLSHYKTAYPRTSKLGTDPENGLASIEALYVAYFILNRNPNGLLDHYHWKKEFLELNNFPVS
jgi:pre-rRNA-processing protein TSR3